MSYTKKVAYNTIIQVIGKIIVTIFSIVSVNILTRYLGVEGYGRLTIIFAYLSFWQMFTDFGLLNVLVREMAQNEKEKREIFHNAFTFRLVLSLSVIVVAVIIARFLNYDLPVKNGIVLMGMAFIFQAVNMSFISFFQNQYQMYKGVIADTIGKLIILLGIYYVAKNNFGFLPIMLAYAVGNIINVLWSYLYAAKLMPVKFAFNFALWKRLMKEALPIGLMGVFGYLYFRSDALILSLMKSSYDVGIYGPTYKIFEILIVMPSFLTGAAFPAIAQFYHSDKERLQKIVQKIFNFLVSVSIPLGIAGFLLAEKILILISGGGEFIANNVFWRNFAFSGVTSLKFLMLGLIISYANAVFGYTIIAAKQQKRLVVPTMIYAIFNISFNLIFIPHFSYIAAAFSTMLTEVLIFIVSYAIFQSVTGWKLSFNLLPKIIIATGALVISIFLTKDMNIGLTILFGIMVYFALSVKLKIFSQDVVREIFSQGEGQ